MTQQIYNRIPSQNELVQIFQGPTNQVGAWGDGSWRIWQKPKGVRLVTILCLGGGGGGGGGGAQALNSAAGGGAGGQGGALTRTIIPAMFLPDILYIRPGVGGQGGTGAIQGGAAATAGRNGGISYVSIYATPASATPNAQNIVCLGNGGGGGGAGGAAGGTLGTQAAAATIATSPFAAIGIQSYSIGAVGIAGATTGPATVTPFAVTSCSISTGGGGGAGVTAANATANGGAIGTVEAWKTTIFGGDPGENGINYGVELTAGHDIFNSRYPLVSTGGAGGNGKSGASVVGAKGGCGGFGSGGGGGGGSNGTGCTGGEGGGGGGGLVVIISSY